MKMLIMSYIHHFRKRRGLEHRNCFWEHYSAVCIIQRKLHVHVADTGLL